MSTSSNWTGERLETYINNEIMVEHLHRYAVADELVKNKKVLDLACGEGYGSFLMATKAHSVTGIDNNSIVIKNASEKYKRTNLEFIEGQAEKLPFEDHSYDLVVSFETLEHLENHQLI